MNKRQTKKKNTIKYTINGTAKQRRYNKWLCKRYPFLIPRRVWDDKACWEDDKELKKYSFTLAEDFPRGWWKAFGLMMCEEIRDDLIKCNYLKQFRVEQIKEKYGQLRFYFGGIPRESKVYDIVEKYSCLSENICVHCGKPDVPMLNYYGWFSPHCEDCFNKIEKRRARYYGDGYKSGTYSDFYIHDDPMTMPNVRRYTRWDKKGSETIEEDISETVQKIRENYYKGGIKSGGVG